MATQSTKIGPGKVRVHVAAFGKHPGWDDHIEEIGLDSDELVRVKRLLYTEGMSGNIDAGAWEKLDEDKRLATFRHLFYWKDRDSVIVGRLWSSSDGKGRTKYPMVVAAEVEGVPQWWAIEQILPRLEAAEARCVAGKSADAVRAAIGECRRGLEDAAAMLTVSPTGGSRETELLPRLLMCSGLDADGQAGLGLSRILYEIDREMGAYKPSASRTRTSSATLGPAHVRVPRCLTGPGEGARAWLALLKHDLSPSAPVLIIEPIDQEWLDVVVGTPSPASLFCVRAAESGMAYTSRVPYTIPSDFAASAAARVSAWVSGQAAPARPAPVAVVSEGEGASKGGLTKWLVPAGGILLVGLGVAILSIARCGGGGSVPPAAGTPPVTQAPPPVVPTKPPAAEPSKAEPKQAQTPAAPKPEATKPEPPKPEVAKGPEAKPVEAKPTEVHPAEAKPAPVKPAVVANGQDPRATWTFRADVERVSAVMNALDAALAAEGGSADSALRGRLAKLGDRAELVRAMPWSDVNADAVRRGVDGVNQDLAALEKETVAALAGLHERVRASFAALPVPVTSEPFVKAWNEAIKAATVEDGRAAATKRLTDTAQVMAKAEAAFRDDPFATPLPSDAPIDVGAITASAAEKRAAAMAEAARVAAAGDGAKAGVLATEYSAWAGGARTLAQRAIQLASAIGAGSGLTDAISPQGGSVGEAAAAIASSPLMKDLGVALSPVLSRVDELRLLASSNNADDLLAAVAAGAEDSSPMGSAKVLGGWQRLAAIGWPTDDAGFARAGDTATGSVAKALGKLPQEARAGAAAKSGAASAGMLRNYLSARGGTEDGLSKALAARAALGVTEDAGLPGWVRYNLALRSFADQARTLLKAGGNDAALQTAAQKFLNDATDAGPEVLANPAAAAFLSGVRSLSEKAPEADLSKLGPAAVGWAFAPAKGGGAVFTWPRGGVDYTLTFQPVTTASGAGALVCTTELSLGLFLEAVNAANKWDDLRKVMGNLPIAGGKDLRVGPRAWVWTRRAPETMSLARVGASDSTAGWLSGVGNLGVDLYYSPELSGPPAPPSLETPVQYISPASAVLVAKVLGCRLPTSEEWTAAVGDKPGPANLRDATWKKQFTHVQGLAQKGMTAPRPNAGAFWPSGSAKPGPDAEAEAATDTDDGVLWFSPVVAGEAGFKHLVGNVAEYVVETEGVIDGIPAPTADAVVAALGKGERMRVIGGSALSAKSLDPRSPQGLNWTQAKEGYSDVGMRLAFSAPAGLGAGAGGAEWKKLVDGAALLTPPAK